MSRITWVGVGPGIEVVSDLLNFSGTVSATDPALVIPMSALLSGGLNSALSMQQVEKVVLALHRQISTFTKAAANLNDSLMEVDAPTVGTTSRANTANVQGSFRTLDYAVSFYKPDAITSEFDPDNLDIATP
jgi:hypothetical protein